MGIYAVFWHDILERFKATRKTLQDPKLDLNRSVGRLKSLRSFVDSKRNSFDEYEAKGKIKSGTAEYAQTHTRLRRRSVRMIPLDYAQAQEAELTPRENFRLQNFLPVID